MDKSGRLRRRADWRRVTSIEPLPAPLILKSSTTGKIAISPRMPIAEGLPVFDLSEPPIVPIVCRVKTDPARTGSSRARMWEPRGRADDRVPWGTGPSAIRPEGRSIGIDPSGVGWADVGVPGGRIAWIA